MRAATIFSGGELAGEGMQRAGLNVVFGVEYDDAIATVARQNDHRCLTEDVTTPGLAERLLNEYGSIEALHASPPCQNASVAKANGCEDHGDMDRAEAVCRFLRVFEPRFFTLGNVWGYRHFKSFRRILACLLSLGYAYDYWHLCAADYAVPQTRRRLILAAQRGASAYQRPQRPRQTHAERPPLETPLFGATHDVEPWRGWYDAVADLLSGLPDTDLAPWQKARLKEPWKTLLLGAGGFDGEVVAGPPHEPAFTLTANTNQAAQLRAVLINGGGNTNFEEAYPGRGCRNPDQPSHTVTTNENGGTPPKAVLLDTSNTSREATTTVGEDPSPTVQAWHGRRPSHAPVALLLDGQKSGVGLLSEGEVTNNAVDSERPSFTISSGTGCKRPARAIVTTPGARVVQLDARCLARLQSIGDDYELPENKRLACRIIGQSVPPLWMRRIWEGLLGR